MRRSMVIYMGSIIAVLIVSGMFVWVSGKSPSVRRYHQHIEQMSETELDPCSVCGGDELCTHLPIISVDTGGAKIPGRSLANEGMQKVYETSDNGEEEIPVFIYTVDKLGEWHHIGDAPTHTSQSLFRVRGNSSRWFDKSSYRLKLIQNNNPELENHLPLLGMESGDEWVLHGPFLDKTLMRNYAGMNISAEVMGYAPNVRFCELIVNGRYEGVYLLMETIAVQEGRLSLTKYKDGDLLMSYLVRLDSYTNPYKTIEDFHSYTRRNEIGSYTEVLYPGLKYQTEHVHNYIKTDLSNIEKTLYSLDMMKGLKTYESLIDVSSFVDYYLLQEFLAINDSLSRSTYFYKDVRGKLSMGPVWDYNNSFDNFFVPFASGQFILSQRLWYGRLMMDDEFVERVIRRWRELRKGVLSEERLLSYHTETELWLGSAIDRNFEVWGYSFDPDQMTMSTRRAPNKSDDLTIYDVNPSDYKEAMEMMLDYMVDRGRWIDEHIESFRQYCHPSRNSVWVLD